jgi:S-adenosylmethionine:tRNA ribosyltransferase-isomerase
VGDTSGQLLCSRSPVIRVLVSDFDFDLPEELIAQQAAPRGASRLLVLDRATGATTHTVVSALPRFLRAGDLLVVNDTRVFAARLLGTRVPSGGAVECLLLTVPVMQEDGSGECDALMHPGQKLRPGARVRFDGPAGTLHGTVLEQRFFGRRRIRLVAEATGSERSPSSPGLVDALGHMPLPPYIKRADTDTDRERYQTIFASARGSVAAPTAGLHFTPEIMADLSRHGVEQTAITLHVGYGTFKPIRTEQVEEHEIDPEAFEISQEAADRISRAQAERRRVVAVGTTTTRTLETVAAAHDGQVVASAGESELFIYPGFQFRVLGGLLTNFHLPQSSLLILVCAFAGRELVLDAYRAAIAEGYRYYSYGDAMLIL